jgi:hypothetical protein
MPATLAAFGTFRGMVAPQQDRLQQREYGKIRPLPPDDARNDATPAYGLLNSAFRDNGDSVSVRDSPAAHCEFWNAGCGTRNPKLPRRSVTR